jgi:hypothetical protein
MRTHFKLRCMQHFAMSGAVIILAWGAEAAELPLSRVVLSTAGLAQFTHAGPVAAGSSVELSVRLDQVDDILKSLTVMDRQGAFGAVRLPGKTPLAELFKDLPFVPEALNSEKDLLNALVGSEVEVEGKVTAKGRVLKVVSEDVTLPNNGGKLQRHRLTLMSDKGLVQTLLDDVTSLRFSDARVTAQIERALTGLTENRAKERRQLAVDFLGQGTRNVLVSYVVGAPVWKTAYRLVLPKDGGKARLQGWAVVENLTGGDWREVDLVLTSGNPVAFHQPLYSAIFPDRIEVPVTTAARVKPRTDDADDAPATTRRKAAPASAMRLPAPAPVPEMRAGGSRQLSALDRDDQPLSAKTLGAAASVAEAEEASTQLLYRFPAKVSLATGHTMMVPFIDREVAATRTWLYQPETSARRPLAAVRLNNDGDTGLPAGIVTAYDTQTDGAINFVGDAQLPLLAKGASRFVVFALDAKTDIRREDKGAVRTTLGKAAAGTLTVSIRSRRTIDYEITAPADEDRDIVVEEVRADGWTPAPDVKGVESTPTRWRYAVAAPKGRTTKAALVLERVESQTVVLTSMSADDILATVRGLQNENEALKQTVTRLGVIVGAIAKATVRRTQLEAERDKITEDQERIRSNLQSVGANSDLGRRYLNSLKTQEDRLGEIARLDAGLESEIAAQRQAAEEVAKQLKL